MGVWEATLGAAAALALALWTLGPTEAAGRPAPQAPGPGAPTRLREILRDARHPATAPRFRPPTAAERAALEAAIVVLEARSSAPPALAAAAATPSLAPAGFEAVPVMTRRARFVVLREREGQRTGGGAYVMRCGPSENLAIQAPHTFFDLNTFGLSERLLRETHARWLLVNTLHRFRATPDEVRSVPPHPADVAHNPELLFQAATLAIQRARPDTLFVQLHGFDSAYRQADVVLSDGRRGENPLARGLAELWTAAPWRILTYGKDIRDLGARANVQARALNERGGRFLHIELAGSVRRALVRSKPLRRALASALVALSRGAQTLPSSGSVPRSGTGQDVPDPSR